MCAQYSARVFQYNHNFQPGFHVMHFSISEHTMTSYYYTYSNYFIFVTDISWKLLTAISTNISAISSAIKLGNGLKIVDTFSDNQWHK